MKKLATAAAIAALLVAFAAAIAARAAAEEKTASPLEKALHERGLALGAPVFLRIFKNISTLELWMWRGERFVLFRRYGVCRWSGMEGPKLAEGDRQSPEGVYHIAADDLRLDARWSRAMNINFPNAYDRALGRTGSGILIHGGCGSIGCFALTNVDVEEVYALVAEALEAGQSRIGVHVFPFPLTAENLARHEGHPWIGFWRGLRPAYALFERDRLPPQAALCGESYGFKSRRRKRGAAAEKLENCLPLTSGGPQRVAAIPGAAQPAARTDPRDYARDCDPRQPRCRMLRAAMNSKAICPKKYARCRNPAVAAVKSADCPLKFPRCRKRGAGRLVAGGEVKDAARRQ